MGVKLSNRQDISSILNELQQKNQELQETLASLNKAKKEIAEKDLVYQKMFEQSTVSISLLKGSIFIECNNATCRQFSCRHEDVIGKSPLIFSPEYQPDGRRSSDAIKEIIESVLSGKSLFFRWRHVRKNGEEFDAEISLDRVEIDSEPYILSTNRDISERLRAETAISEEKEKLRISEERFHAIFENAPIGILHVNLDGIPEVSNREIQRISGYSASEIASRTYLELSHPDDRDISEQQFKRMLTGELEHYRIEKRYIRKDGAELWVNVHTALIRDKNGKPETVIGMIEDITSRKKAEGELRDALEEVTRLKRQLESEKAYLLEEINLTHNFGEIVGQSKNLRRLLRQIEQVASSDSTVLILGETGTGKELFARAIHNLSPRANRPMVKVNCAALPANLIESELFGHEKGAFTGAISRKIGKFELANKGTIFLDEVGDLPLDLQAKLLRVLQENEFERLGSNSTLKTDVRVLAATNKDLAKMRDNGDFREDLFFRLNVFPLECPPLRKRKEDIPMLTKHFMEKYRAKNGKRVRRISESALNILQSYNWPGNIRELENIVERAVVLSSGEELYLGNWFPKATESSQIKNHKTLDQVQAEYIIEILKKTNGRVEGPNGAAEILGIKPPTLRSRMLKLGIKVERKIRDIS